MAFTRGKMSRGRLGNGNGDELLRTLKHELGDKLHHDDGDTYQIGDHTGHNQHHSAQYHERTLEPLQAPAEEEALEAGGQQIGANERGNQAPEDVQHAALHQQYRIVDKQVRHEEGTEGQTERLVACLVWIAPGQAGAGIGGQRHRGVMEEMQPK